MAEGKRIVRPESYPWDPRYQEQPYSLAVERNGFLCISGLTAEVYDQRRRSYVVESISLVEQTKVIFEKMGAILEAAGYSFQDLVYTVDYALEPCMPEYRASGEVRREAFGGSMPAATGVLVEGLPDSTGLMKVNAVAMRGGRDKKAIFPEGTPTWERFRATTFWPGFFVGDDWFWLSGSTGRVFDAAAGREVYPEGLAAQREAIWESNLGQVMRDAGVERSALVRSFDYVHPAAAVGGGGGPEAAAAGSVGSSIVVRRLLHRPALLEIDATCYLGADREVIELPGWGGEGGVAAAVRCGKMLFCSAQSPIDRVTGRVVGEGDLALQVARTYENVLTVLEAAGAGWGDVVRSIEMTSPRFAFDQATLDRARRGAYGEAPPSLTTVTANQMATAGTDFAMEIWAVLE